MVQEQQVVTSLLLCRRLMKKHIVLPLTLLLPFALHGADKKPAVTAQPSAQPVTAAGKMAAAAATAAATTHAAPLKKSSSSEKLAPVTAAMAATSLSTPAAASGPAPVSPAASAVIACPLAPAPVKPAATWQWSLNPLTGFGYWGGTPAVAQPALARQTTQS